MHKCWSNPYSTFRKAFFERLGHLCCKWRLWVTHDCTVNRLSNHAMEILQIGVQLWSETELIVLMDVAVQHGMHHSSLAGTVPRQWQQRPQGRWRLPGLLLLQTDTPADRSGAGPAWMCPPSPSHHGTWAQRTFEAEKQRKNTNVRLQFLTLNACFVYPWLVMLRWTIWYREGYF